MTQDPVTFEIYTCRSDHSSRIQEVDVTGLTIKSPLESHHMTSIRSVRGAALYVTPTRPELAFEISHVACRAQEGATKQELLDANKLVRRARGDAERGLRFVRLCDDWAGLILAVFSDAGWASRASNHSQAGGLHFICDKLILEGVAVKGNLLDMICNKISLQVIGSHDAEGHALRQNLEGAEHLQFLVFELSAGRPTTVAEFLRLPTRNTLAAVVDNKGLFTQVDMNKVEKRRSIYIMLLFEYLRRLKVLLFWVHSGHMLADPLTKLPHECRSALEALLDCLTTNEIRITYDMDSYRRALQKQKVDRIRLSCREYLGQDLPVDTGPDTFEVPPRPLPPAS